MSDLDFRDMLQQGVEKISAGRLSNEAWQDFAGHLYYQPGKFTSIEDFQLLAARLSTIEAGPADRLFYLATSPSFFSVIVNALGETGLTEETVGWRRVVIEKPFGTDAETARELNQQLHQVLDENQIYRIDHYLGKEYIDLSFCEFTLRTALESQFHRPCTNYCGRESRCGLAREILRWDRRAA
jgi:glucose-6-phosphate 1-dehydrogenase